MIVGGPGTPWVSRVIAMVGQDLGGPVEVLSEGGVVLGRRGLVDGQYYG